MDLKTRQDRLGYLITKEDNKHLKLKVGVLIVTMILAIILG